MGEKPKSLEQVDEEEDFMPRSKAFDAEVKSFAVTFEDRYAKLEARLTGGTKTDAPKPKP